MVKPSKFFTIMVFILVGSIFISPVYAQVSAPRELTREKLSERTEKIRELKNATVERRCKIITQNIQTLLDRYNRTHEQQVSRYNKIKSNLKKAEERLKALGYDISSLSGSLEKLDIMIVEYDDLHTEFHLALKSSTESECGKSNGEFVSKVKEAQDYLKQMREKAKEIVNFYKDSIRKDLQDLRSQKS